MRGKLKVMKIIGLLTVNEKATLECNQFKLVFHEEKMNAMQITTVFECSPVQYVMKVPWTFAKVATLFKSKRFPLLQASFNRWTIISSFLYIKQRKMQTIPLKHNRLPLFLDNSKHAHSGLAGMRLVECRKRIGCSERGVEVGEHPIASSRAPPLSNTSRSAWVSLLPHVPIKVASLWFTQSLGVHFFSKQATNNFLCKHAHGQLKTGFLPLVNSKTYETRQ